MLEFSKEIFVWMKIESLSEYLVGGEILRNPLYSEV
jgi:hypothetical protein